MFGRREVIGVGVLAAGVVAVIGALALFSGGGDGDEDGGESAVASSTPAPAVFSPVTADDLAIEALARRSIEVLPAGQWPALYADFTPEFQARCPQEQFDAGGEANATELGTNLQLLGYRRLEDTTVGADSADAVIVGELRGQSEYRIKAAFQRVDGTWMIAPAADTSGCQAFIRLE
jgi:hypothetical protein